MYWINININIWSLEVLYAHSTVCLEFDRLIAVIEIDIHKYIQYKFINKIIFYYQ